MQSNRTSILMRQAPTGRPANESPAALVVPVLGRQDHWSILIAPGSAIAAYIDPKRPGEYVLYYEGNKIGESNLCTLVERGRQAYGRMVMNYPTAAKIRANIADFEIVGEVSFEGVQIEDAPALKAWIALDPDLDDEGNEKSRRKYGHSFSG